MGEIITKTTTLNLKPCGYRHSIDGNIIKIEPVGNGKTITNDIENVVATIEEERGIDSNDYYILYLDSEGMWVWVLFSSYGFPHFRDMVGDYEKSKQMLPVKAE